VRLISALDITIQDNCMIASQAYITDSDWHGIYNRITPGNSAPILIEDNAWIGDSVIVCKGVTVGANSIIGAGAVVVDSIPPNTVAAGNPARVVKELDPQQEFTKRSHWFSLPNLDADIDQIDRDMLENNTILHWLRYLLFPRPGE